jgi:hypothetical protein
VAKERVILVERYEYIGGDVGQPAVVHCVP